MARFLGNASGRTVGAAIGASGFTKAKVFSTPGTTTFTVPQDVQKLKVFVIGAGSCYRSGTYCFNGTNCCSGVDYPNKCYSACFTGHLTGAGGGYSEKTFLQSSDLIAGKTLTINVGSIGGLSASSVSGSGLPTVTASNATESTYNWSCTNNSTARDNSNDNPISIGIQLPRCGYQNSFSGYYNNGGTASGGDINRTGGRGVLIPEFLYDSCFDSINTTGTVSGTTVNKSSCWQSTTINCACANRYHFVFGGSGSCNYASCVCGLLANNINNLCCGTTGGSTDFRSVYSFIGKNSKESGCISLGAEQCLNSVLNPARNQFIKDVPIGIGAQSGNSSNDGKRGASEAVVVQTTLARSITGGSTSNCIFNGYYTRYSYDFVFGGSVLTCYCLVYDPGVFSADSTLKLRGSSYSICSPCSTEYWFYIGGSQTCIDAAPCHQLPYGNAAVGGLISGVANRVYNLGFVNDENVSADVGGYQINLSALTNENGLNINDITYGKGAGISESASYGGGGNRLYPNGGSGLVVVIY
jgi:hypothetical protein